jgi:hypothetical protein
MDIDNQRAVEALESYADELVKRAMAEQTVKLSEEIANEIDKAYETLAEIRDVLSRVNTK